jgi:hypothetical protein
VRGIAVLALLIGVVPVTPGAQPDSADLAAFQRRLDQYVELHRRLEGPLPPLQAASDFGDVQRLMAALRAKIQRSRQGREQPALFTPGLVAVLRANISAVLTVDDIAYIAADVEEHSPPNMPPVSVNAALPQDAPLGFIPPELLRALPPLPPELRYVVLSGSLIVWDHHADLVVDIAPRLFDPLTYSKKRPATAKR